MPARLKRFAREMKPQPRVLYLSSRDPRAPLVAKLVLIKEKLIAAWRNNRRLAEYQQPQLPFCTGGQGTEP